MRVRQAREATKTIAAYRAQRLIQALGYLPVNITNVMQSSDLRWDDLEGTETRLDVDHYLRLWDEALDQSDLENLGLHVGQKLPMARWELIEQILHSSLSVGDALRRVLQYWNLIADEQRIGLSWGGDVASLEFFSLLPDGTAQQHHVEAELLYITRFCQRLLTSEMRWHEITFLHPPLGQESVYAAFLDGPVLFNQQSHALRFDAAILAGPLRPASEGLREQLQRRQQQRSMVARSNQPLSRKVKRLLQLSPLCQNPERIAQQLNIDEAALEDNLQQENVSFEDVVEQVLRNRAQQFLHDLTLPLSEAAFLLGFSNTSAFNRTIQRWFGQSPSALRKKALSSQRNAV